MPGGFDKTGSRAVAFIVIFRPEPKRHAIQG
jgi:hypothetical protein